MPRPKQSDPVAVFEAGRRAARTVCNALANSDPSIQLAASRVVQEAARNLPDAICEELRLAGDQRRRERAADLGGII